MTHLTIIFFFNDTATTEIYTLSLHDALPIYVLENERQALQAHAVMYRDLLALLDREALLALSVRALEIVCDEPRDRKSTRLNSSHGYISYAGFCLKKTTPTPH